MTSFGEFNPCGLNDQLIALFILSQNDRAKRLRVKSKMLFYLFIFELSSLIAKFGNHCFQFFKVFKKRYSAFIRLDGPQTDFRDVSSCTYIAQSSSFCVSTKVLMQKGL